MPDCAKLERDLEITYRYFSHHIRTCTSVVVAMLDVVTDGLADGSMTGMIMEAGYLLDIYDRGMSVCFNHIMGKPYKPEKEELDLGILIDLYAKNAVSPESGISIKKDMATAKAVCDAYSMKSFLQILMQEGVASSAKELTVSFSGGLLTITPDKKYNEIPPVFSVFTEIMAEIGILMTYDIDKIELRFTDESLNS